MLDQFSRNKIAAAITKVFDYVAGDHLVYYPPTWTAAGVDSSVRLRCIIQNVTNISQAGVTLDEAGVRDEVSTETLFLNSDLTAAGVTLDSGGWFKDDNGVRWDFEKDKPILTKQVAIGAIHNITAIQIRRAVEAQINDEAVGEISFSM